MSEQGGWLQSKLEGDEIAASGIVSVGGMQYRVATNANSMPDIGLPWKGQWLPIETAPKDGTRIFVTGLCADGSGKPWDSATVAYWYKGRNKQGWIDETLEKILHELVEQGYFLETLTHWMPIPPYPTEAK